jgi:large-conductance mechanosensitive channel
MWIDAHRIEAYISNFIACNYKCYIQDIIIIIIIATIIFIIIIFWEELTTEV